MHVGSILAREKYGTPSLQLCSSNGKVLSGKQCFINSSLIQQQTTRWDGNICPAQTGWPRYNIKGGDNDREMGEQKKTDVCTTGVIDQAH